MIWAKHDIDDRTVCDEYYELVKHIAIKHVFREFFSRFLHFLENTWETLT